MTNERIEHLACEAGVEIITNSQFDCLARFAGLVSEELGCKSFALYHEGEHHCELVLLESGSLEEAERVAVGCLEDDYETISNKEFYYSVSKARIIEYKSITPIDLGKYRQEAREKAKQKEAEAVRAKEIAQLKELANKYPEELS